MTTTPLATDNSVIVPGPGFRPAAGPPRVMPRDRPRSCSLRLTSRRQVLPKLRTFSRSPSVSFTRSPMVWILADSRQLLARTDSSIVPIGWFSRFCSSSFICGVATTSLSIISASSMLAGLKMLHERVEVLAQNLGGLDQGHVRGDRAVGPDFHDQAVVVGLLADAACPRSCSGRA